MDGWSLREGCQESGAYLGHYLEIGAPLRTNTTLSNALFRYHLLLLNVYFYSPEYDMNNNLWQLPARYCKHTHTHTRCQPDRHCVTAARFQGPGRLRTVNPICAQSTACILHKFCAYLRRILATLVRLHTANGVPVSWMLLLLVLVHNMRSIVPLLYEPTVIALV